MKARTWAMAAAAAPALLATAGAWASDLDARPAPAEPLSTRADIFYGYVAVFVVGFLVTLLVTPLLRSLALSNGIIDHPDETRKQHRFPIAYLGGVAVYLGLLAAIGFGYIGPALGLIDLHPVRPDPATGATLHMQVPPSVLLGMTVIMFVGLWDDVTDVSPLRKIGGQLAAAAFLAMTDVGVRLAYQVLHPVGVLLGNPELQWNVMGVPIDLIYWIGTGLIAVFVLGACNASNLIDGLDGLCSGVHFIAATGLLVVALGLAMWDQGRLDSATIILCLALMGATMGFLPHNFNPANIFLGDSGSLLLGFVTVVIILMLGDTGRTDLVLAGLIIYSIPIIDTTLAIVRRKLAGQRISAADDQHLHHILKRALGVKGAVVALYGMGAAFAILGIALTEGRARVTYAITLVFVAFIGVTAIKIARRKQFEEQAARLRPPGAAGGLNGSGQTGSPAATLPPTPASTPASGRAVPVEG